MSEIQMSDHFDVNKSIKKTRKTKQKHQQNQSPQQ